jgi:nitrogen regulatory protein P-II 1
MYLILFVLHNPEKVPELLDAWEEVGVSGITILHSSGLGRVRRTNRTGLRDDLPLIPSLEALLNHEEYFSRTIFSIVQGEEMVDKMIEATQRVVGDLSRPDTGLLVALPVLKAYGLDKQRLDPIP